MCDWIVVSRVNPWKAFKFSHDALSKLQRLVIDFFCPGIDVQKLSFNWVAIRHNPISFSIQPFYVNEISPAAFLGLKSCYHTTLLMITALRTTIADFLIQEGSSPPTNSPFSLAPPPRTCLLHDLHTFCKSIASVVCLTSCHLLSTLSFIFSWHHMSFICTAS